MTERLHFHFSLAGIGEGNGNPLQCSCLENPRDGGAWWAAVYGVAQHGLFVGGGDRVRMRVCTPCGAGGVCVCACRVCAIPGTKGQK